MTESAVERAAGHRSGLRWEPWLAGAAAGAIFFLMRGWGIPGGDTEFYFAPQWISMFFGERFIYYPREPLAHGIVWLVHHWIGDLPLTFSIVGAVSGGFYIALLAQFRRRDAEGRPDGSGAARPLFWAINLASILPMVFVGHLELYAPYVPALTLYILVLTRALEPGSRVGPLHVTAAFLLAYCFHKLTLFFLPSMFWLAFRRVEEAGRRRWRVRPAPGRAWEWSMLLVIVLTVIDLLPGILYTYGRSPILYFLPNEKFIELITPLNASMERAVKARNITGMYFLYTLGQPLHWAYFFSFLFAGAPLGVPLALARLRRLWAAVGGALRVHDGARALATAALCGVIWIFFWHPRGMWRDWDLFCISSIPINLLAAGLWTGLFDVKPERATDTDRNAAIDAVTET